MRNINNIKPGKRVEVELSKKYAPPGYFITSIFNGDARYQFPGQHEGRPIEDTHSYLIHRGDSPRPTASPEFVAAAMFRCDLHPCGSWELWTLSPHLKTGTIYINRITAIRAICEQAQADIRRLDNLPY